MPGRLAISAPSSGIIPKEGELSKSVRSVGRDGDAAGKCWVDGCQADASKSRPGREQG